MGERGMVLERVWRVADRGELVLTKDERLLLERVVKSLNELFDGVCTVADVHALLVAARMAVGDGELKVALEEAVGRLGAIVGSDALLEEKREQGLAATDGLRSVVAERLRADGRDNPKGRHRVLRGGVWYDCGPGGRAGRE
jgi:hypothetical protein